MVPWEFMEQNVKREEGYLNIKHNGERFEFCKIYIVIILSRYIV